MRRAVFLDRDGVLNRTIVRDGTPYPPRDVGELELLPGVAQALSLLAQQGFLLVVVTNQPDVARGTQTRETIEQINQRLRESLPILAILTCYHDNADQCACRKPRPGMILEAAKRYDIDLRQSFMVGDRWSDVAAGRAAGCTTLLIDVSYNQRERCIPDYDVADLLAATEIISSLQLR
jgi:D-glycero-D-manno-heptose 1,7-bisphosphate phosphatase